jgi:uncharacterized protein
VNPFARPQIRDSSPAEIQAFSTLCERLGGFDDSLGVEYVDGYLASLAAGPVLPPPEQWLPALCGDAFQRAFSDPADHQQALRVLHTRLKVLCEQLNPEALLQDPQMQRLSPLMMDWTEADRQQLVDAGTATAEEAALLLSGVDWADGFFHGTEAFGEHWLTPLDEEAAELRDDLLDQVLLLMLPPNEPHRVELLQKYYPDDATSAALPASTNAPDGSPHATGLPQVGGHTVPQQDQLITEALFAVQDLRLFWLDHQPKPSTRQAITQPGRNEPCHCGSGKKFKKCHGANA